MGEECSKDHYTWEMIRKMATEANSLDIFTEKSFDPTRIMSIKTVKKDH